LSIFKLSEVLTVKVIVIVRQYKMTFCSLYGITRMYIDLLEKGATFGPPCRPMFSILSDFRVLVVIAYGAANI